MAAKELFAAFWIVTLIGGLVVAGGLGSLTHDLGVNDTPGYDFRLYWFYWSLEVFALVWAAVGAFLGQFHAFKFAFVGLASYVNVVLTPVIQIALDLPAASNITAVAAGLLIVVISNFVLILLTAFYDTPERPTQVGTPYNGADKV